MRQRLREAAAAVAAQGSQAPAVAPHQPVPAETPERSDDRPMAIDARLRRPWPLGAVSPAKDAGPGADDLFADDDQEPEPLAAAAPSKAATLEVSSARAKP